MAVSLAGVCFQCKWKWNTIVIPKLCLKLMNDWSGNISIKNPLLHFNMCLCACIISYIFAIQFHWLSLQINIEHDFPKSPRTRLHMCSVDSNIALIIDWNCVYSVPIALRVYVFKWWWWWTNMHTIVVGKHFSALYIRIDTIKLLVELIG